MIDPGTDPLTDLREHEYPTDDPVPHPSCSLGPLVVKEDRTAIFLLGGYRSGNSGVILTEYQALKIFEWLDTEYKFDNDLIKAGSMKNLMRIAENHGLRLIAFLAERSLLDKGVDPIVSVCEMIGEYLEGPYPTRDEDLTGGE